jgi:hypothetical protein
VDVAQSVVSSSLKYKTERSVRDKSYTFKFGLLISMAALANALSFLVMIGPWQSKFSLTGLPILIAALSLGPSGGAVCGLLGGWVHAVEQGSYWFVVSCLLQGAVAGLFARYFRATRYFSPFMGLVGGFIVLWWVDLIADEHRTLDQLTSNVADIFSREPVLANPIFALLGSLVLTVFFLFISVRAQERSFLHLLLAGCCGAIADVLFDALLIYGAQPYPWTPMWYVFSLDLIQGFFVALVCTLIFQHPRVSESLLGPEPVRGRAFIR